MGTNNLVEEGGEMASNKELWSGSGTGDQGTVDNIVIDKDEDE